jgi:fibronectin-binding autotransporter adhesin
MKPKSKAPRLFLAAASIVAFSTSTALADLRTWSGLGADASWQTPANWDVVPVAADTLAFDGSTQTSNTNDFAPGTAFGSITFNVGASAFTLSGNSTQLGTAAGSAQTVVTNNSTATQTLDMDLTLASTFQRAFSATSGNISLTGDISGNAVIGVSGGNTVILGGTNTNAGGTFVQAGSTLAFSSASNLSGKISLGQQATNGILLFNGASDATLSNQVQIGNGNTNTHNGDAYIYASGTGTAALIFGNATFNLTTGATAPLRDLVLQGTSTANNTISGIIQDNSASSAVRVLKRDAGTWVLGGNNTFTGELLVQQGTLAYSAANNLGAATSRIIVGQQALNATLLFNGTSNATVSRQIQIGNGALGTDDGDATLTASGTGAAVTYGNATFNLANGGATAARILNINGTNNDDNTISGAIVDNSAGATVSVVKGGTGTWVLNGDNSFTGEFAITGGTVKVGHDNALGAGIVRFGQAAANRVQSSDATARTISNDLNTNTLTVTTFGAAGTGNLTFTDSFDAGVASKTFNIDSITAEFSGVISGGGPKLKGGNGTLVLSGANTYTGNTNVSAGTLVLASTGDLRFGIGASGVNNQILGTASATLDGEFVFDLTGAGTTVADSWTIVDVATLSESYGGTFTVSSTLGPFTNSSGTWTRSQNSVTYQFVQSTGILSVISGGANYSTWASAFSSPALSNTASTADPDNDGLINAIEYALGLDPRFSSPSPAVITNSGKTITYTKGAEAKVNGDVTYGIETSTTLALGSWTLGTSPEVTNGPDTIAITFPAGPVKNFARLKVTLAP